MISKAYRWTYVPGLTTNADDPFQAVVGFDMTQCVGLVTGSAKDHTE